MIIHWNMAPEIFQIGFLAPRWYGLMFAMAFLVGSFIGSWIFKREGKPPQSLDSILLYMLLGTVIGARLGECLFYNPAYYLSNPLEIFKIWKGGLVLA
jgi:phosphatidylglycerol---prolipoprotein diacylglyceryl transferase